LLIPDDVVAIFQSNTNAWENFNQFPPGYRKLRIGFVLECRKTNLTLSNQRLDYLIKMCEKGKMFGTGVE
jgi:Bacteriocin-protection, YdeI or OmpD-Associated